MRRTVSSVKAPSKKRTNGPMAVEALLSLALDSSSAERPSTSRRLMSLPSVAPTMAPLRVHHQHHLRLGIVPGRDRVQPRLHAVPDRRHRLRLGEDLRIRADADLQVLRPGALLDQHALELGRLRAARHQLADIAAEAGLHAVADRLGLLGRAARLLLDHALQHGQRKGDAGGLDRLQVVRRQQPGLARRRASASGVLARMSSSAPMRSPLPLAHDRGRIGGLAQVAHGRRRAARCRGRRRRAWPPRPGLPPPAARRGRPARPPCRPSAAWRPASCDAASARHAFLPLNAELQCFSLAAQRVTPAMIC